MVEEYDHLPDAAEATPIRVGIVGAGLSGTLHLAAARLVPGLSVVALVARRKERAAAVALETRVPRHGDDFRAVCRDPDIDAVIVAVPPHLHHSMVIAALEGGKHVLCEKPMARNVAEARDMQRIADRSGVVAMVNHQHRFLPIRRRIKELVESGYVGDPHAASVVACRSSLNDPWDRPWGWLMEADKAGGILGASGVHYLDALRWWLGEVKGVAGALATQVKERRLPDGSGMARVDADDNVAVLLRFASGALGTVHITATAGADGDEEITVAGSRGLLTVRGGVLRGAQQGGSLHDLPVPDAEADDQPHYLVRPTAMLQRMWADAIRDGRPASPTFADGVKVQELVDAVGRSGAQGRWIDTSGQRWPLGGGVS
jgi:predicted dehydrogenase